jgi:hypothetical protein
MSAGPGSAVKEKGYDVVVTGGDNDENDYQDTAREDEYAYDYNNNAKTQRANHSHSSLGYKKPDFYQHSG